MTTPGPLVRIPTTGGGSVPFYAVRFDKAGAPTSPATSTALIEDLQVGDYSDVFVLCHGWNNDWDAALDRYQLFVQAYQAVRETYDVPLGREHRALFCGVFWPSTAMLLPWERGPDLAAAPGGDPADAARLRQAVASLADDVPQHSRDRFRELVERPELGPADAAELAALLAPVTAGPDEELEAGDAPTRDAADLLAASARLSSTQDPVAGLPTDPFAFGTPAGAAAGSPEAAGFLDKLDPRALVRVATVYQMKDRAGRVGVEGVGPLLRAILGVPGTRVHLVGHSYGGRVLLNAVSRPQGGAFPRPVDSLLLLQAAINHLCFSADLPGAPPGRAGGYRAALDAVRLPILTTFSDHDVALHDTFHLALRRRGDLGEVDVAAAPGEPPSRYCALGGYGPRGTDLDWRVVPTKLPSADPVSTDDFYDFGPGAPQIWALDGHATIHGHGDVVSPTTAWALLNLVTAS